MCVLCFSQFHKQSSSPPSFPFTSPEAFFVSCETT